MLGEDRGGGGRGTSDNTEAFEELAKRVMTKVKDGDIKVNFHGVDEPANTNHNINTLKKKRRFYCC